MMIDSQLYIFGLGIFYVLLLIYSKINKEINFQKKKLLIIKTVLFIVSFFNYRFAFYEGSSGGLVFLSIDSDLSLLATFYLIIGCYLILFRYKYIEK